MYILCYFVILISFCEISFVNCLGDIHILVTDQNNKYELHDKNVNLDYNDGDLARLRCIISTKAFGDGKKCTLTWMDDKSKVYLSRSEQFLELNLTLTYAEDGLKLHCEAVTEKATLSLYVNFARNKTEAEISIKKPNIFWILIISICGFVGGSFIILIIWSLVSRLCKKKVEEGDTQVIFCEDLDNTQNNLSDSNNTEYYTEIDVRNHSEVQQNGGTENDIDRREEIDSDRREECKQNSLYINVEESKRHGSSTEC